MPPRWLVYIFGVVDRNMKCCMVEFYKCDDYVCCHYFGAKKKLHFSKLVTNQLTHNMTLSSKDGNLCLAVPYNSRLTK